jgi:hypothetical protein
VTDINDTPNRIRYSRAPSQTVFAVPFEFQNNSDIRVFRDGSQQIFGLQYTLTGAGVEGGGNCTFFLPGDVGEDILIIRDVPIERQGDFPVSGPFSVASLNSQLDRLTMMARDLETRMERRFLRLATIDQPETMTDLPNLATRASRVLGFDINGNPIALNPANFGAKITVSTTPPVSPAIGDLWVDAN